MINFKEEVITAHLSRIYGLGDACMYFVKGENSALLIDTAYGVGDLRGYIESIWSKPYEVVITHGHADHVNGVDQWDEVYMNSKDIELFGIKTDINLRRTMLKRTVPDIEKYPDSEFHVGFHGKWLELDEGKVFDLGGVHVETVHAPGHTQGIMTLLIHEDRIMIFGDACGVNTFLFKPESSTVEVYKNTLFKLMALNDKYDRILRQHGTCESPISLVEENIEVANEILEGKDDHIPFEYLGEHVWMAKEIDEATHMRKDGKSGNIVYSMEKIR